MNATDCGHECCSDPTEPFHDHFLDPSDCPGCARAIADREERKREAAG